MRNLKVGDLTLKKPFYLSKGLVLYEPLVSNYFGQQ
jgi:hypothetical protein